jgi:L-alanine-DL-glutamate epimerase-like enolase superfamily enzyme
MKLNRRQWAGQSTCGLMASVLSGSALPFDALSGATPLVITGLTVTPIALADPPILAASGCHGPYFLRNVVQLETDAGIVGIGETQGGESKRRTLVRGQQAMAEVRKETGLTMSTNMCVTRFEHVPDALRLKPVDVVLADHHYWGGMIGCQALGQVCNMAGWRVSQHSNNHAGITMAAMVHLAAVVPQITLASDTHYPWLPDAWDIIEGGKLPIRAGAMKVPEVPASASQWTRISSPAPTRSIRSAACASAMTQRPCD